ATPTGSRSPTSSGRASARPSTTGSTTATSTSVAASACVSPRAHRRRRPDVDQRVSFITLVVADLEASRRFYVDGLGWDPELYEAGEVLMFRVAEKLVLSLWSEAFFVEEVGHQPARGGVPPITLAHN